MSTIFISLCLLLSCSTSNLPSIDTTENDGSNQNYTLPNIDLSHWKLTLPIGAPTEISPPEIKNYANMDVVKPYMYNDSVAGALVFYATPGTSTANSSYSRSELREQMEPGNNNVNWTFAQGGYMKGTLQMGEISKDASNNYHKTIIMQIHGRLSNAQRDAIGAKDNNGPPVLKIYWEKEKIKVAVKNLKNIHASDEEILKVDAWTDQSKFFNEVVGFNKFTLEVKVTNNKMTVTLNNKEQFVYDDIHMQKWGVYENYFKAGNYFQTRDKDAFARVKYYDLIVQH